MASSVRVTAAAALADFHRRQSYSNIVLDELLKTDTAKTEDKALLSRLFYGVIERRLTIDYVLSNCSSTPVSKMHPLVRETLRVAVYQLLYMDRIPASAAVNEAVIAVKKLKQAHASGFVNGVLRGVIRQKNRLLDNLPDNDEGLSVKYSCPTAWITFWRQAYGEMRLQNILQSLNEPAPEYIRINTLKTTDEAVVSALEQNGISCRAVEGLPHAFAVSPAHLLNKLEIIDKNCYYYQDIASQWACFALNAQPGDRVADVCAAPGGKSFTVAQGMQNNGYILSCDLYEQKCRTMQTRATQYGITVMETAVRDAAAPVLPALCGTFDRVICDVPCSGLGVIRRKPEIRYKSPSDFADLPALQYTILEQSAALLCAGGILQYSTCTLNPAENEAVITRFLQEHPEFSLHTLPLNHCFEAQGEPPSGHITLFPSVHGSDGFFICQLCKNEV